jgi:hypothetical protein
MISEPVVRLAQNMQLSRTDANKVTKWTKTRFNMAHVTKEFHRVRPKWFLSIWYVWHKPSNYLASRLAPSPNGLNQASAWASSPRSTIVGVQNDSGPIVRLAQTMQLSCTDTNTISKQSESSFHLSLINYEYHRVRPKWFLSLWYVWCKPCTDPDTVSKRTETRFHMAHVTKKFHRVRPKWFLSLWYIWRKPSTYLVSRLAPSPNKLNRASTWASSPRSTIGCVQNIFWAYGTFDTNRASYLASRLALSINEMKRASTWASSPRSTIGCVQNDF